MTDVIEPYADAASSPSFLEMARMLVPLIESEADEVERQGRLTPALVDAFSDAGLFWMLVPTEWGGGGTSFANELRVVEEVAAADGSTGWCLMVSNGGTGATAGFLPPAGARDFYAGTEKVIACGTISPTGTGREVDGGLIVTGRWAFGSTSHYATNIGGGIQVVDESGKPRFLEDGRPDIRIGYFPREKVVFHDNWDVTGLRGTGSQDYSVQEQFVAHEHCWSVYTTEPERDEARYALGPIVLGICGHAAVALGLASRALREVATITKSKVRASYPVTVDRYPVFRYEFSTAEADFQAARAYFFQTITEIESYAEREGGVKPAMVARSHQSTTWVHLMMRRVVSFAHLWSASQAIQNPSKLGRVSADAGVITQHLLIDPITLVTSAPEILELWARR